MIFWSLKNCIFLVEEFLNIKKFWYKNILSQKSNFYFFKLFFVKSFFNFQFWFFRSRLYPLAYSKSNTSLNLRFILIPLILYYIRYLFSRAQHFRYWEQLSVLIFHKRAFSCSHSRNTYAIDAQYAKLRSNNSAKFLDNMEIFWKHSILLILAYLMGIVGASIKYNQRTFITAK